MRSHSVGFVSPRTNHDLLRRNYVLESIEIEFFIDFVEVSIGLLIVEVFKELLIVIHEIRCRLSLLLHILGMNLNLCIFGEITN